MSWPSKMSLSTLLIVRIRGAPILVWGIGPIPGISTRTLINQYQNIDTALCRHSSQQLIVECSEESCQHCGHISKYMRNKAEYNLCQNSLRERTVLTADNVGCNCKYVLGVSVSTEIHTSRTLLVLEKNGTGAPVHAIKKKTGKTK